MKIQLAQALIERGILNNTSRVYARCPVLGMGNAPTEAVLPLTVDRIISEDGTLKLHCVHTSGRRYSIPCEHNRNQSQRTHKRRCTSRRDIRCRFNCSTNGSYRTVSWR